MRSILLCTGGLLVAATRAENAEAALLLSTRLAILRGVEFQSVGSFLLGVSLPCPSEYGAVMDSFTSPVHYDFVA